MQLTGWVEYEGIRVNEDELLRRLQKDPLFLRRCGGEFYLEWQECRARDPMGIIPGPVEPGTCRCAKDIRFRIDPDPMPTGLAESITTAVRLRADEGIVAFSGGVDSALIGALASLPLLVAGKEGSHDLRRAEQVADQLHLPLESVTITEKGIDEMLPAVLEVVPRRTVTEVGIALTLSFVGAAAKERGCTRILSGQGADELFGGYARYERSIDLPADLRQDVIRLPSQIARDQAVAGLFGVNFSFPYLDVRVMRAARAIPAQEKIVSGVRKLPLRKVAANLLSPDIAFYQKKAMQYGSGVESMLRSLARNNGYKNRVQEYILHRAESP